MSLYYLFRVKPTPGVMIFLFQRCVTLYYILFTYTYFVALVGLEHYKKKLVLAALVHYQMVARS